MSQFNLRYVETSFIASHSYLIPFECRERRPWAFLLGVKVPRAYFHEIRKRQKSRNKDAREVLVEGSDKMYMAYYQGLGVSFSSTLCGTQSLKVSTSKASADEFFEETGLMPDPNQIVEEVYIAGIGHKKERFCYRFVQVKGGYLEAFKAQYDTECPGSG